MNISYKMLYKLISESEKIFFEDLLLKNIEKYELQNLLNSIYIKDRGLYQHSIRVAYLSYMMSIDENEEEREEIFAAALMHDLGKTRIKTEILNKETVLTDEEKEHMKLHTMFGYSRLKGVLPEVVRTAVLFHHERLDGTGYYNIQGHRISKYARILAIADVYDAMTTDRVYRKKLSSKEALDFIYEHRYILFDPIYVRKLMKCINDKRLDTNISVS